MATTLFGKKGKENGEKEEKGMFRVEVEGTYWADAPNNQVVRKQYKVTCNIPSDKIASINGILKARVLPQLLSKNDVNFKRLRTQTVVSSTPVGDVDFDHLEDVQQIRIMNLKQLQTYVKKKKLPIDVTLYQKIEDLRQAIQLCMENEEFYLSKEKELSEGLSLSSDLADLNKDAKVEAEVDDVPDEEGEGLESL